MTDNEIRERVLRALRGVAPEIDPASLKADADLREQVDLDSMDVMNLVVGIQDELGVAVPDTDLAALTTLDAWIAYLRHALDAQS